MYGGQCHFIPPVVRFDDYVTESSRTNALFIGTVPVKGIEIAFRIAEKRPNVPFSFVESWLITPDRRDHYGDRADRAGNITWSRPVANIRDFYAHARLLLAPSLWEESFGRVVPEAQASGIPVLASDRGGLPETVGAGGIVVDPHAPLDDWLTAFDSIWSDEVEYARLCDAARSHAMRPEIAPERIAESFIAHVTEFVASRASGG